MTDDQRARFEQAARDLGIDLDEARLRDALRRITPDKSVTEDKPDMQKPAD